MSSVDVVMHDCIRMVVRGGGGGGDHIDNPGVADRSRWHAHQIRLRRTGSLHTQRSVHVHPFASFSVHS